MANLFELLGIEPTNDLKIVVKAYLRKALQIHPDKFATAALNEQEANTAEFQRLAIAYDKVDNESKLNTYFSTYRTQSASTSLGITERANIKVFIPVKIIEQPERPRHLTTQTYDEACEKLATILTHRSQEGWVQVGVTFQEATDIASNDFDYVVQVSLPINRLSDNRLSEENSSSTRRTAGQDYITLLPATIFNATDILMLYQPKQIEKAIQYLNTKLEKIGLPALSYESNYFFPSDPYSGAEFSIPFNMQLKFTQYDLIETLFRSCDIIMKSDRLIFKGYPDTDVNYPALDKALLDVSKRFKAREATIKKLEQLAHALNSPTIHCFLDPYNLRELKVDLKTDPIVFASHDSNAMKELKYYLQKAQIEFYTYSFAIDDGHPRSNRLKIEQHLSEKLKKQIMQFLRPKNAGISGAKTASFFGKPPQSADSSSSHSASPQVGQQKSLG